VFAKKTLDEKNSREEKFDIKRVLSRYYIHTHFMKGRQV